MQVPQQVQYAPVSTVGPPVSTVGHLPQQQIQAPITVQPQNTATTSVVVQQQPVGPKYQQQIKREWTSGLFDCCSDMGSCCGVLMCGPCYLMTLSSSMGEGCFMPCVVPGAGILLRTKLRTEQKIKGTILKDCCIFTWCGPCALCQLNREWKMVQKLHATRNAAL